jgi:hypothetical protein
MPVPRTTRLPRAAAAIVLPLAAACTDQPLAPVPAPAGEPAAMAQLECTVQVRAATLACAPAAPIGGALLDRIIGGQESYVRLATTRAAYDAGLQRFEAVVTVQNLLRQSMGTPDGATVEGVRVFFHTGPVVTSGSGVVAVHNADGTDLFLSGATPYFLYPEILAPYQISAPRGWEFDVPATVNAFRFTVYLSTPLADPDGALLDRVWTGAGGSAWEAAGSWSGGEAPNPASTVAIPADSLLGGAPHPVLAGDAEVTHLRVGSGSILLLDGHTLTAWGNVDAAGAVAGGTLRLAGTRVVVGGALPALRVTGSARLQRPVVAGGAVSISDGSLGIADVPLSIQIP